MNRRQFLGITFTGISSYAARYLIVPPTLSRLLPVYDPTDDLYNKLRRGGGDIYTMYELLAAYSSRVAAYTVGSLTQSTAATSARASVDSSMAKDGYRDREQTNAFLFRHYYTNGEYYAVAHDQRVDICAPFFQDYVKGKKRSLFEAAAVIGTTIATAQYKYENPQASNKEVSSVFYPTARIANAAVDTTVGTTPTVSTHKTDNGSLVITSTPDRVGGATVTVEAKGGIKFKNDYPFEIIERKNQ